MHTCAGAVASSSLTVSALLPVEAVRERQAQCSAVGLLRGQHYVLNVRAWLHMCAVGLCFHSAACSVVLSRTAVVGS